ncbi:hypothetical protein GE115_05780 [Agromyces sp. CFH 90414]|uniref:DoxX family protein n=1 Tax=Agromyces agglutinans TaxID=2662258 RepID=A0A6I2FBS7_9MICO|nr:hypothetical protein [Agromyces agglutinans]MRG59383.1 hypothetical protein [Agromyces agglutinans]
MAEPKRTAARGASFWICYVVVLIGAGVGLAHTSGAIVDQGLGDADALFAAARSIAIFVLALVAPMFRSDDALLAVAVVLTIVLGIDAFIGAMHGNVWISASSVVLCLGTLVAATFVARSDRIRDRA